MNDTPHATVNPISMGGIATGGDSKYRVVLVKPEEFDAATVIAKHVCQGDTVILNCEDTNEAVARRVIDFLSGCAFALSGSIMKASSNVIIIAPKDVGLDDAKTDDEQLDA
jgi:cell division inhibitor SepF